METIILRGNSKTNLKLLLRLAKQLNFSAKKLTSVEAEDMGIAIAVEKGLKSGLLHEQEKNDFLSRLKHE